MITELKTAQLFENDGPLFSVYTTHKQNILFGTLNQT